METLTGFLTKLLLFGSGFLKDSGVANILKNFQNQPTYFFILLFIFIVVFLYGMNAGRGRVVMLLISLDLGVLLTTLFPYQDELIRNFGGTQSVFLKLGLFLISVFVIFYLLLRSPLKTMTVRERDKSPLAQILVLSLIILGIATSFVVNFLTEDVKADYRLFRYFSTPEALFWWVFGGILFLALLKRERRHQHLE